MFSSSLSQLQNFADSDVTQSGLETNVSNGLKMFLQ